MQVIAELGVAKDRARGISAALAALRRAELVVFPTDTMYGVAGDAFSPTAAARLRTAKGRGRDLPLPVLVGYPRTLEGLVTGVSPAARALVEAFWPGPLTLIGLQQPSLAWDLGDGDGSVAVRMPLHPVAIDLLRAVGPLVVTTANRTGMPPAQTVFQSRAQLGDDVAVYLDAGEMPPAPPSSVVDVTGATPVLVRVGALSVAALRAVVPGLFVPGEQPVDSA